jgi:phosphatidylserine decarboxylase
MTIRSAIMKIVQQEAVNFHLTNSIPRRLVTRWTGWFSKIDNPAVCAASLFVWRLFTDLDLSDAQETRFRSMHDCFTRRLKDGARPIDPDPAILVSPCDAIVGSHGMVVDGRVFQVKGMPYTLSDLFGDDTQAGTFRNGCYVTLRLTSAMYHRFHAPYDCCVNEVAHLFGDTWNVNPVTLRRVDRLYCKNERAVISTVLPGTGHRMTLVAVAAIMVAGIRLGFLNFAEEARSHPRTEYGCDQPLAKGAEMGWFEHGSTILVFVPEGFTLCDGIEEGTRVRAGQALLRLPPQAASAFVDSWSRIGTR